MKLTDLNPTFLGHGGEGVTRDGVPVPHRDGVGIIFDCPCGSDDCPQVYVAFANPLSGGGPIDGNGPKWQRVGSTFNTLTLKPSIQRKPVASECCNWHGWIRNGEIVNA